MTGPPAAVAAGRIVGTAGHIDHGKTALALALTGVATDRLPEERARGISIELGFAPLDLGPGGPPASLVDVPGHEAFVRTMVAGATGVDVALFVVAADEGMMPQSREHLLVLEALGVRRGVVALTKCDAVDPEWAALVGETVREELQGSGLADAPICRVSARTGEGIEALRAALGVALAAAPPRRLDVPFRLAVDRAFAVAGAGTVVTGTVWSGAVAPGASLTVLPGALRARARAVEVHGRPVTRAEAGQRAAIALAGVEVAQARRGSVLVSAESAWRATRRVDAWCWLSAGAPRSVGPRTRLRVLHGTTEALARISWHGGGAVAPGGAAPARLLLESPIVPAVGDRFVLRAYSPVTTIGGGTVLAVAPSRVRGRSGVARRDQLASMAGSGSSGADRLRFALDDAGPAGLDDASLPLATGLGTTALVDAVAACGAAVERHGARWFSRAARAAAVDQLVAALGAHHAAEPLQPGWSLEAARQALKPADPALIEAVIATACEEGRVVRRGTVLARAGHTAAAGAADQRLLERVRAAYAGAGLEPPELAALADALGVDAGRLRALQRHLEREGELVRLAADWYADAAAVRRAEAALISHLGRTGPADTGACKALFGVSRKYLIPLLEHFDRQGVTRREGNQRVLAAPAPCP